MGWFLRLFRSAQSQPLEDARARRSEALRAVQDATERRDDRDLGRALMVLRQATHDELSAAR